ncbi:MAG: hypothetical protein R3261_07090 [Alphaproteobacteria bacterium]|nr:hypothetical protein [Alphaproteobacteria bacterium]
MSGNQDHNETSNHQVKSSIMEQRVGYGPELLGSVLDDFLSLLEKRLIGDDPEANPSLSGKELRAALLPFRSRSDQEVRALLNAGWKKVHKASEEAYWAKMRTHPLERIMVNTFAHLLAPYGDTAIQGVSLSRRVIPAFSAALRQMMGPELIHEYEERAQKLVEHYQNKSDNNIADWDELLESAVSQSIVNDILVYIAQYFLDMPRRRQWMVDFFLQNMGRSAKSAEQEWEFDNFAFFQLTEALYGRIFQLLDFPQAVDELKKRYGPHNMEVLIAMQQALIEEKAVILGDR